MSTENNYVDVRLFYSKTGSAKYISHLDTMRAFQRAFRRCRDLDFWYTEGFNPHLYLTFALPLSLGYESGAETVDFRLASPVHYREVVEKLNAVLPAGFKAYKAAKPVMNAKVIRFADYNISFTADGIDPEAVLAEWYRCFTRESVTVKKVTKRGAEDVDLKAGEKIKLSKLKQFENRFCFKARLVSGVELNINPNLVLQAFKEFCEIEPQDVEIKRVAVYNGKMEEFC